MILETGTSLRLKAKINSKQGGFSLLELIIVLVIIGVIVAAISLSFGDSRANDLRLEARKLAARIGLATQEAILTSTELGLEVGTDGYQFLVLDDQRWQVISEDKSQFTPTELPEGMSLLIEVEGLFANFGNEQLVGKLFREVDELADAPDVAINGTSEDDQQAKATDSRRPQVYILSSGELSPFRLVVGYADARDPLYYLIDVSFDAKVSLHGPFYEPMDLGLTKSERDILALSKPGVN